MLQGQPSTAVETKKLTRAQYWSGSSAASELRTGQRTAYSPCLLVVAKQTCGVCIWFAGSTVDARMYQGPGRAGQTQSRADVLDRSGLLPPCSPRRPVSSSLGHLSLLCPPSPILFGSLDGVVPRGQPQLFWNPEEEGGCGGAGRRGLHGCALQGQGKVRFRTCVFLWLMPEFPGVWRTGLSKLLRVRFQAVHSPPE